MIISKDKYPILGFLEMTSDEFKNKNNLCTYNTDDLNTWRWAYDVLNDRWGDIAINVSSNIDYVSMPFFKAVWENIKMFSNIDPYEFVSEGRFKGVMLLPKESWVIYDFSNPKNHFFMSVTERDVMNTFYLSNCETDTCYTVVTDGYNEIYDSGNFKVTRENKYFVWFTIIFAILMFKKYAKVETKILKPNEKSIDIATNEKHLNKHYQCVTILDCTWFTNIIRRTPFGVRGHFRLQPKKNQNGDWIKEMIYIEPFMKNGYAKRAKIETQDIKKCK